MGEKSKFKFKNGRSSSFLQIFYILSLIGVFAFLPQQNSYSFRAQTEEYAPHEVLILPTPMPYPINQNRTSLPELSAEGIMIFDIPSGVILLEKNADLRFFPASTTKIMTALVATREYSLDDIVTVKTVITEGQVMGLIAGEKMTVENLLYGTLVHSANDAAYALAEHHPGGYEMFIRKMNELSVQYHLTNTHFVNPIGFDDPQHYTTPKDLARLATEAAKNPTVSKIVSVAQITISDVNYMHFHPLKNLNILLGKIPGVSGFKTGWTENAGQSLVTTVKRDEKNVVMVILKSDDRFGETEKLLDWVFANYEWKDLHFNQSMGG